MSRQTLLEMAKAAQERLLDRLPVNKKYIFLVGRFLELRGEHNTIKTFQQYLQPKLTAEEFDMDAIANVFGVDPKVKYTDQGTRDNQNSSASVFHARFETLYNNMKNSLVRAKDNIDKDYVDKVLDFYSATYNHEDKQAAYDRIGMGPVIEWLKNNKDEAEERFGYRWPKIQRMLAQWLDDDYEGSIAQTVAMFWDWWRGVAQDERANAIMPTELALRLAKAFTNENIREILGNYHNFVLKKTLVTLTADGNNVPGELKATLGKAIRDGANFGGITDYCKNLVNTWFNTLEPTDEQLEAVRNQNAADADNDEVNADNYATTVNELIPDDGLDDIFKGFMKRYDAENLIDVREPKDMLNKLVEYNLVDFDTVGKANKASVRDAFHYARSLANRFKVGTQLAFDENLLDSIQEFYNRYKYLFKIGLTKSGINAILEGMAEMKQMQLMKQADDYWANKNYQDVPEDYELEEALRVLHKHGFMID